VGSEGGEEAEELGMSESRQVVSRKPPQGPRAKEIIDHNKTHLPFRPWCPICVQGRGKNWAHYKAKEEEEESRSPELCLDYCFLRDRVGGPSLPVLVGKDRGSGAIVAHAVPEKGAGLQWTAKQLCRDLVKLGIGGQVVIKGDQEPALVSVIEEVVKLRGSDRTIPEYSPVGESQSNGLAERGVQTIEGLVRSHKLELEKKLGESIDVEMPVMSWLVEHCADLQNKYHVHADGRTSWERLKGKKHHGEILEFGQRVLHRLPGKTHGGLLAARWMPGVWLGKRFTSEEHILGLENGRVVRARAVRSMPPGSMWCKESLAKVIGVPWRPSGEGQDDGSRIPEMPRAPVVKPEEPDVGPKSRAMKIMPKHLVNAGYTPGCPKCRDLQQGTQSIVGRGHTAECRRRIEEVLKTDDKLKEDVERAENRKNEYLTRHLETEVEGDEKKRRRVTVEEIVEETAETGGSSGSGLSQEERDRAITQPVPDDDGEMELEEVDVDRECVKRSREEGDDGGEDQRPAIYRQLPERDEKRERGDEGDHDPREHRRPRLNERGEYEKDLEKLRVESDTLDLLGLTEKQWRTKGESMCDIAEVFSPPRTTARARERGLRGGWSLDKEFADPWTGRCWNLSDEKVKESARNLVKRTKPKLLIASPPCTLFSQIQYINGGPKDKVKYEEAVALLEFAVELCLMQVRAGRKFIFEHPAYATSWRLPCLMKLREASGVQEKIFHMCQYGMRLRDKEGEAPVKKATRVCTNSVAIAEKLGERCPGNHRHVILESGRPALAAAYPKKLQDAFIDGLLIEEANENSIEMELMNLRELEDMCDPTEEEDIQESLKGRDDVTGKAIDPMLIQKARREELEGFAEFEVYEYVRREVARRDAGGKFVGTRWVDHNKGTDMVPEVRSRLVGQEFARGEVRDDLFAATPPLTATRLILSAVASRGRKGPGDHRVMLLDVKKAFLYGKLSRSVYIELPEEDPMSKSGEFVGRLKKAMYGLRDAPQVWQAEVKKTMTDLGYTSAVATPCVYFNQGTQCRVVAHVDDFLCTGPQK